MLVGQLSLGTRAAGCLSSTSTVWAGGRRR